MTIGLKNPKREEDRESGRKNQTTAMYVYHSMFIKKKKKKPLLVFTYKSLLLLKLQKDHFL